MFRPPTIVFVAATALACAALVCLQLIGLYGPAAVAKVLASAGFLLTAISAGALGTLFGRLLFTGLVLSFAGDVFLIGTGQRGLLLGLASFLIAHLLYIAAFAGHGLDRRWLGVASVPLLGIAVAVTAWLTPHIPPGLVTPVRAYTVVITVMVIAAFGARGHGAPRLALIGAVLFFVSDLSVAALRIVGTELPTYAWGLPAYYAGQLCLAVASGTPQLRSGQSLSQ